MKKRPGKFLEVVKLSSIANGLYRLCPSCKNKSGLCLRFVLSLIAAVMPLSIPVVAAPQGSQQLSDGATVQGSLHDSDGTPVGDAVVRLEQKDVAGVVKTKTNAEGEFTFSNVRSGSYVLSAE